MKRIETADDLEIGMTVVCQCSVGGSVERHFINSPPFHRKGLGLRVETIKADGKPGAFFLHDFGIDNPRNPNRCFLEKEFDIEKDLLPGDIVKTDAGAAQHGFGDSYEFVRYVTRTFRGVETVDLVTSHDESIVSSARHFVLMRRPPPQHRHTLWGVRVITGRTTGDENRILQFDQGFRTIRGPAAAPEAALNAGRAPQAGATAEPLAKAEHARADVGAGSRRRICRD